MQFITPMRQSNTYLDTQPNSRRTLALIVAGILHVILIYALISGLGRRIIEVVQVPVEATLIAAVKPPPPPPPPPEQAPPPKLAATQPVAPPPAFIPPPEVKVAVAPQPQNTLTAVVPEKTPEQAPLVIQKPIEPVVPAKPSAPAAPKPRLRAGVEPIYRPPVSELLNSFPPRAKRQGISGRVALRLTINSAGEVINVVIRDAQPKNLFDRAATEYVQKFRFEKGEDEFEVDQVIEFHAE